VTEPARLTVRAMPGSQGTVTDSGWHRFNLPVHYRDVQSRLRQRVPVARPLRLQRSQTRSSSADASSLPGPIRVPGSASGSIGVRLGCQRHPMMRGQGPGTRTRAVQTHCHTESPTMLASKGQRSGKM